MRIPRTALVALLPLGLAIGLAACGESDSSAPNDRDDASDEAVESEETVEEVEYEDYTDSDEVLVEATDNRFTDQYVEVKAGTTVEFVNDGLNPHNVFPSEDDAFEPIETENFDSGDEGSVTFDETGEFLYYCTLHGTRTKGMVGRVNVVE